MSELRFTTPATLDQASGRTLWQDVVKEKPRKGAVVVVDFSETDNMDSRGSAWLLKIVETVREHDGSVRWESHHGEVSHFLNLLDPLLDAEKPERPQHTGFFAEIGGNVLRWKTEFGEFFDLLIETVYWTLLAPFFGQGYRVQEVVDEIHEMGVRAVRINVLMNFLLGLIIAMLSAAQVASFGLGIYVADLIVIGFARELAAIMTAVVVAARTGAAITAEISSMKVQEEIDALRGMGINVTQFLVTPRLIAMTLVMPCLVAMGMVAGVLGGALWGILVLDIRPMVWFDETLKAVDLYDVSQGIIKSLIFAVVIVLVGCHNGFRVKGGSRGVGLMTTRSVVMDIFFIIAIDMVFAMLVYYILE